MNNMEVEKINKAINFAIRKHMNEPKKEGDQYRKGGKIPYLVHPLGVMNVLLREQASNPEISDELVIAAILHDTVEDTKTSYDEIKEIFDEKVEELVKGASEPEDLKNNPDVKGTWKERKEHTINFLKTKADKNAKIISCADKYDNARAINKDLSLNQDVWSRFNASKEDVIWYYESCLEAYQGIEDTQVYRLLKNEVGKMRRGV